MKTFGLRERALEDVLHALRKQSAHEGEVRMISKQGFKLGHGTELGARCQVRGWVSLEDSGEGEFVLGEDIVVAGDAGFVERELERGLRRWRSKRGRYRTEAFEEGRRWGKVVVGAMDDGAEDRDKVGRQVLTEEALVVGIADLDAGKITAMGRGRNGRG